MSDEVSGDVAVEEPVAETVKKTKKTKVAKEPEADDGQAAAE